MVATWVLVCEVDASEGHAQCFTRGLIDDLASKCGISGRTKQKTWHFIGTLSEMILMIFDVMFPFTFPLTFPFTFPGLLVDFL